MAWCSAVVTFLCLLLFHVYAFNNFKIYCHNLPNLGIGVYQKDHCTVTFRFSTGTPAEATEMCAGALPFNVKDSTHGEETKCVYAKEAVECEAGEVVVGKRCFTTKGNGLFTEYSKACGERYRFHVIESEFDRQWIALRMQESDEEMWVGISGEYFYANRPIAHKGNRTKRGTGSSGAPAPRRGKIVKMHMKDVKKGNLIRGKLRGAVATEKHPFLCSRKGKAKTHPAKVHHANPPGTAPAPPPATAPPETAPPETAPPETAPPETAPPETAPPETAPPKTAPPPSATKATTKRTKKQPATHKPGATKKRKPKPTKPSVTLPPGQSLGPIDSVPPKKA